MLNNSVKKQTKNIVQETEQLEDHEHAKNEVDAKARICETADCFKKATNTIEVKAGNNRTISLFLCSVCLKKFSNSD